MRTRVRNGATLQERIFAHVWMPAGPEGCWSWTGRVNEDGYARIWDPRRKTAFAHRLAYEAFRGEIDEKHELDHICRVRNCVNPWHLEEVPHKKNVQRGNAISVGYSARIACEKCGGELEPHRNGRSCRKCRLAYLAAYRAKRRTLNA